MSKMDYTYDLQKMQTLGHLPNTILTISEMKGENIGENARQYFVNTVYRLDEKKRTGTEDAGIRRTAGFSIQAQDIPNLCAALMKLHKEASKEHYFVCQKCSGEDDQITIHRKASADAPESCDSRAGSPDSFVIK